MGERLLHKPGEPNALRSIPVGLGDAEVSVSGLNGSRAEQSVPRGLRGDGAKGHGIIDPPPFDAIASSSEAQLVDDGRVDESRRWNVFAVVLTQRVCAANPEHVSVVCPSI